MFSRLARYLAQPHIVDQIWCHAFRQPTDRIATADGATVFLWRYWLFRPRKSRFTIQLQQICRPYSTKFVAPRRTWVFILKGWFTFAPGAQCWVAGEYFPHPAHRPFRIGEVSPGGCLALVITL